MRRALIATLLILAAAVQAAPSRAQSHDMPERVSGPLRTVPDTVAFDQDYADGSQVSMTVTNYGFFGNNFFSRKPSFEYPKDRGYEHMVRGGLWVGAHAKLATEFDGVVSGTVDAAQGPTSPEASEFTPASLRLTKRSTLPDSEFFDRDAVSELDVLSDYNDFTPTRAASNSENHTPINLEVHQETYQWNFAEFKNILFVHFKITNRGPLLTNMWVGLYSELASGFKDGYVRWPPSSTDPGGLGSWFNNKWIEYDEDFRLFREHYCDAQPVPEGCLLERAPYWAGIRYLGARGLKEDLTVRQRTLSAWSWRPGSVFRDEDRERYQLMSTGVIQPLDGDSLRPGTGDPVAIYSVGPFPYVYRDSSITVDFAFVGGAQVADIQTNSTFAQFAYDHDYILPVPPPAPKFTVVVRDTAVDFYWDKKTSESAFDITSPDPHDFEGYRLYIGDDPDTMARVAQFDLPDTSGFNTGIDTLTTPKRINGVDYNYHYSVSGLRNGFKYYCAVTAYDLGNSQIGSLESGVSARNRIIAIPGPQPGEIAEDHPTVFPNPYRVEARWDQGQQVRDHYLWFTNLPRRCTLRIYTLSGDLVFEKDFDGDTYRGEGARGIFNPDKSLGRPTLSGSTFGWNLITTEGQAVATGLYLYSVEPKGGGKRFVGKFLIVKSDQEGS